MDVDFAWGRVYICNDLVSSSESIGADMCVVVDFVYEYVDMHRYKRRPVYRFFARRRSNCVHGRIRGFSFDTFLTQAFFRYLSVDFILLIPRNYFKTIFMSNNRSIL